MATCTTVMPAARTMSAQRKIGKEREVGGGEEAGGSEGHDEQADDHGLLVAELFDELAAGIAEDEVGAEEVELDVLASAT